MNDNFLTSTVSIGYSTDKNDYDIILNNQISVASATFTFTEQKTFLSAPVISSASVSVISSLTATSGIKYECGYRSGTVELKKTIREKVINIGSWNMVSNKYKTCTHGLSDINKIYNMSAFIINDDSSNVYPIKRFNVSKVLDGSIYKVTTSTVQLICVGGFRSASSKFTSTSVNRGTIVIMYNE